MFRMWLFLARRGWFHTDGVLAMAPTWWPRARVAYWDEDYYEGATYAMPIGNCVTHAASTGGVVVPADYEPPMANAHSRSKSS